MSASPTRACRNIQEVPMKTTTKHAAALGMSLLAVAMLSPAAAAQEGNGTLKQAKLIIEHNATDKDTGFQAFVDAEGWEKMAIIGPNGVIAEFEPDGDIKGLGITELFLETVEPENKKMALSQLLKKMPAGRYTFRAKASKLGGSRGFMSGHAILSHKIPRGVTLLEPRDNSALPVGNTVFKWLGNSKALDGSDVKITMYQLIVEKDEKPHRRIIGKRGLSMYLPSSVTSIEIPKVFFEPRTSYFWEVLAIADSGNQTLKSGAFKTQ